MRNKFLRTGGLFLLLMACCSIGFAQAPPGYGAIYQAINSGSMAGLDAQLDKVKSLPGPARNAFEGALLMRKAGALAAPAQKLEYFKKGSRLLEGAIAAEPSAADYRLLRLIIQEHAPKILGYNKNLVADSKFIIQNFKSLSAAGQQAAKDYSRRSAILKI